MREEKTKQMPYTHIVCDICGEAVDKEHRHTVRGKNSGEDIIFNFHNHCLIQFLLNKITK